QTAPRPHGARRPDLTSSTERSRESSEYGRGIEFPPANQRAATTLAHRQAVVNPSDSTASGYALARMEHGRNPFEKRKQDCLTFCGVGFDQWDYDRHEFLNAA